MWDKLRDNLSIDHVCRAGFMIRAQELWAFAKLLLRAPLWKTGSVAKDSMAGAHKLLKGSLN